MKGGLVMLYLIKPLSRWHRNFLVKIVVLLALAMVPDALASDSLEFISVFLENQMPGNQEIRESYTNFTYKPYERDTQQ